VEGPVTWQALLLLTSATIIVNATTAWFVGMLVYKVSVLLGGLEKRIMRLEFLIEKGK
jgi:hypothetical protein